MIKQIKTHHYFLLGSFVVWCIAFQSFVFGGIKFQADGVPYYEHFKYFVDNIYRGVFPMWDFSRAHGIPQEFFLRRMGSFNPFSYLIVVFNKMGVPYIRSYTLFLSVYFFIGSLGFFKLSKFLLKDDLYAFGAHTAFLFSSLSFLLVNSFIVHIMTPMVWFFYHFMVLQDKPSKKDLFGMTFWLMLLMSTYLPFYFMTIFTLFIICTSLFYLRKIPESCEKVFAFIKKQRLFVLFCIVLVLFASIPGFLFYLEGANAEYVLPQRHLESQVEHAIAVPQQNTARGGIVPFAFFDELFGKPKNVSLGIFYVPIFVHILLLLCFFIAINKRLAFLALFIFFAYIIGVYNATPVYRFLYERVFFFKYFRNFQFFLWLVILPLYIVACLHHCKYFLEQKISLKHSMRVKQGIVLFIHCVAVVFFSLQKQVIVTSYISIALSFCFFNLLILKHENCLPLWLSNKQKVQLTLFVLIFFAIIVHPIEVYHYFSKNVEEMHGDARYEDDYYKLFSLSDVEKYKMLYQKDVQGLDEFRAQNKLNFYISTKWYATLFKNLNLNVFRYYIGGAKLRLYDHVVWIGEDEVDYQLLGKMFVDDQNAVFIHEERSGDELDLVKSQNESVSVLADSTDVVLEAFDANHLKLSTHLDSNKFLVYNDAYTSKWKAFIDGKEISLFRTNVAFKGIFLPKGEHIVLLRYEAPWRYVLNIVLTALFIFALITYSSLSISNKEQ